MERKFNEFNLMDLKEQTHVSEIEAPANIEAIELAPNGLGYGEGPIGVQHRLEDEEDPLTVEDLDTVRECIHSGEALVAVDVDEDGKMLDDDGCPDGRGVGWVEKAGKFLKRSMHRAKVFGGSATMIAAARVGLGEAKEKNQEELYEKASDQLDESEIDHGAHCGEQCDDGDSGCAAVDKFGDHLHSTETYREEIAESAFEAARATGFNENKDEQQIGAMIDDSFDNFREYRRDFKPAKGSSIFQAIKNRLKVVKGLVLDHKETRIVLNMKHGYTIDQNLIRERTGERAQVFAIDGWRMLDVIKRNKSIPEDKKDQAFIAELIYSLAVAATLTKGDLPVDLITPAD
jgi:hypothetical protein